MRLSLADLFATTYRSLRGNLLRSVLTTLSMFMGVAAVTATLNVRDISEAVIAAELAKRDAPQIGIGSTRAPGKEFIPLRVEAMTFLRQRLPGLRAITAVNWLGIAPVVFQGAETEPYLMAVSQDFMVTDGYQLVAGRFFNQQDFQAYRPVAVIDQFLVDRLFGHKNPLGQTIYTRGRPFVVVGVLPTKQSTDEPRGQLLIPLAIYSAMTGDRTVDAIQVSPYTLDNLEKLGQQAQTLLKQQNPNRALWHFNNAEDIVAQQATLTIATRALTIVALVSLVIGGVGIANVMISAVTERIPEIGLRRAIGATRLDIMLQFILEATILSVIGGVGAVVIIHSLTQLAADTFKFPYKFNANTASIALGAALLVGVSAGLPPALRASHIDPVKALKSE